MFGEMRRKKQALPLETCEKILERGNSGVLALEGEEGYPYAVPLSYFYEKQKIFFHRTCPSRFSGGKTQKPCTIQKHMFCTGAISGRFSISIPGKEFWSSTANGTRSVPASSA